MYNSESKKNCQKTLETARRDDLEEHVERALEPVAQIGRVLPHEPRRRGRQRVVQPDRLRVARGAPAASAPALRAASQRGRRGRRGVVVGRARGRRGRRRRRELGREACRCRCRRETRSACRPTERLLLVICSFVIRTETILLRRGDGRSGARRSRQLRGASIAVKDDRSAARRSPRQRTHLGREELTHLVRLEDDRRVLAPQPERGRLGEQRAERGEVAPRERERKKKREERDKETERDDSQCGARQDRAPSLTLQLRSRCRAARAERGEGRQCGASRFAVVTNTTAVE